MLAADVDAEPGLVNLCLESDRPDGQTVHPRAESRTFRLIPVIGARGVVDESKTGVKAENSGTPRSGMVR